MQNAENGVENIIIITAQAITAQKPILISQITEKLRGFKIIITINKISQEHFHERNNRRYKPRNMPILNYFYFTYLRSCVSYLFYFFFILFLIPCLILFFIAVHLYKLKIPQLPGRDGKAQYLSPAAVNPPITPE